MPQARPSARISLFRDVHELLTYSTAIAKENRCHLSQPGPDSNPTQQCAAMEETLKARVYDPLWMLARQWQLGEFQGEDNGSPVQFRSGRSFTTDPLRGRAVGQHTGSERALRCSEYSSRSPGRARARAAAPKCDREIAICRRSWTALSAHACAGIVRNALPRRIRGKFPLPKPSSDQTSVAGSRDVKFLTIMSGRVPDGAAVASALRQSGALNRYCSSGASERSANRG